jgi:hypothetical protein
MSGNRTILSLCLWATFIPCFSQGKIEIFADTSRNDTLKKLVGIFTEQINKSQPREWIVLPARAYRGNGIYIANTVTDSSPVKPAAELLKAGIEGFSINGKNNTVQVIGNSNMAVGHGIFTYLYNLGYRYYFANTEWHIVPAKVTVYKTMKQVSKPSFNLRRIWYGYGTGSKIADADYNFWMLANKQGGALNASFGHAYGSIIARNKKAFVDHPEWFYPVPVKETSPDDGKFDMSREDLVQLIIHDTEKEIEASLKGGTQHYKMISLSPSDGPGTCNTPACRALGTITDRVFYLVNRVAKAIRKKYPNTLIGCLAYGEYINPPSKNVEPNVFVGITTAFNSSKYSVEQLVDEWKKKGALVGIYDYFSWYLWDYDVPGQSLASKPAEVIKSIKKYYAKGVRAYDAESSIGWISKGLGYYLAAKQLWDIQSDADATRKEFFTLCFGRASETMQKLWNEFENYSFAYIREGELARWIDYTLAAEKAEPNPKVQKRLYQVKAYLHWLSLYRNFKAASTESNLLSLLNYGYRKLDEGSVAGYPAFYELGYAAGIPGMSIYDANPKWKTHNSPVPSTEMDNLIRDDRKRLNPAAAVKQFAITAAPFTNIPNLEKYKKTVEDNHDTNNSYWYDNEWVIQIKKKGPENYISFTGDFIRDSTNIKPFKISIYPYTQNGNVSAQPVLFYYEYNKRKITEKISLAGLNVGYYTMVIQDPVKVFQLSMSPAINFSNVMRPSRPIKCTMLNYSFFYVPADVKRFNVIKAGTLEFITPAGRKISLLTKKAEEIQVEVQPGEAGLWRIKPLYDQLYLEGVPPYLGTSPRQMLIPAGIK